MKGIITDIDTGDLFLEDNALAVVGNEESLVEYILLANRGEFKEFPLIGAEAKQMIGGEKDVMWAAKAKKMIKACGVSVTKVSVGDDNTITVE